MKVTKWKHDNVNPDGTFSNGRKGAIRTDASITTSAKNGGCGSRGCNCSPGHWVCICHGYNAENRTVEGETVHFDTRKELLEFLKNSD